MIVLEALESTCCHHILKERRRLVLCDLACMAQHEAKVSSLPGHGFPVTDQSCCYASHCSLLRPGGTPHMQVNAQREKETSPRRSGDPRLKVDCLHARGRGSSAQSPRSLG